MPFKPFDASHSNVKKGSKHAAPPVAPSAPAATKKVINQTRVPKPSGQGPAGSAGYFDNGR